MEFDSKYGRPINLYKKLKSGNKICYVYRTYFHFTLSVELDYYMLYLSVELDYNL